METNENTLSDDVDAHQQYADRHHYMYDVEYSISFVHAHTQSLFRILRL